MIHFLRKYKIFYSIYNFFNYKKLKYNIANYKKYGIKKHYFSSISSLDFVSLPQNRTDIFELNPIHLETNEYYKNTTLENKISIQKFQENGYSLLKSYLTIPQVTAINNEIDELLKSKKVNFRYKNKIMFAIHASKLLNSIGQDEQLLHLLTILLNGKVSLFQSINFINGSEQATHSDSIHMTTYPLGGLVGVWIALDDILPTNGPLHYYPKSHKLPYFLNNNYDNMGTTFEIGKKSYTDYENEMQKIINASGLKKEIIEAKKGDIFLWHANLLHGGEPHTDKTITRKSMVLHYFKTDAICYHEVTQRPALLEKGLN